MYQHEHALSSRCPLYCRKMNEGHTHTPTHLHSHTPTHLHTHTKSTEKEREREREREREKERHQTEGCIANTSLRMRSGFSLPTHPLELSTSTLLVLKKKNERWQYGLLPNLPHTVPRVLPGGTHARTAFPDGNGMPRQETAQTSSLPS